MNKNKRYFFGALVGAVLLNVLFFVLIGWAWYQATHHKHKQLQHQAVPHVQTQFVSAKPTAPALTPVSKIIQNTFQGKVQLQKTFAGPGKLSGLVLALKNQPTQTFIAYYDPANQLMYLGQVINAKGKNTTIQATQQYLTDPQKPIIANAVKNMPGVIIGGSHPQHQITVIVDPNAPLFSVVFPNLYIDIKQEHLQVKYLLVNYLKPMGPNLAGWVLSGKNPAARLQQLAQFPPSHWVHLQVPPLSDTVIHQLRANWNFMQSNHLVPGPATIFQTKTHSYVLKGMVDPESFDQLLPEILSY